LGDPEEEFALFWEEIIAVFSSHIR
jgi:hypothetical protein